MPLDRVFGTIRRAVALTLVAALLSTLVGCSLGIASMRRIGPDPDGDFRIGVTSRAEVERKLGKPLASETLADGNVRALYEYTVRIGAEAADRQLAWEVVQLDAYSLGLTELIFMPIAYFSKTKETYQKTIVYGPDDVIVEVGPETPKARR